MTPPDLDAADEPYAAVGFRITRLRKARGLRQDDLAATVGLTRSSMVAGALEEIGALRASLDKAAQALEPLAEGGEAR